MFFLAFFRLFDFAFLVVVAPSASIAIERPVYVSKGLRRANKIQTLHRGRVDVDGKKLKSR